MALKRINKELTDLGRYVPDFGGHLAAISSQPEINAGIIIQPEHAGLMRNS